jgi:hypothetical protein
MSLIAGARGKYGGQLKVRYHALTVFCGQGIHVALNC